MLAYHENIVIDARRRWASPTSQGSRRGALVFIIFFTCVHQKASAQTPGNSSKYVHFDKATIKDLVYLMLAT